MFSFMKPILSRVRSPLSIFSIGPNQARLLFDGCVSTTAALTSTIFCAYFLKQLPRLELLIILPAATLAFNLALGIYSNLRTAPGRVKAFWLSVSSLMAALSGALYSSDIAAVVLWFLLATPLFVVVRLLLNLPYSKHKNLVVEAVRQRGPITIIGGAGYIGTHLVDLLLKEGQAVRVLDRLMYGKQSIQDFASNKNFELFEGDVTDISKLTTAMKGSSAVVHLSGLVGDPACAVDQSFTRHTNIIATRMAKEVARSLGIFRFVFASSCSVYGCTDKEVREGDKLNPVSLYAQSKIDSEQELLYSVPDDFFVTILRFATVFGHSRRPRFDLVANLFTAQALTQGVITVSGPDQWRPFVHVRDLARAISFVIKADPRLIQSEIFNVGDRRLNMTILQLAQTVQHVVGGESVAKISVKNDISDKRNYAVSFEKIRNTLNFEAATLMQEGISEMVQYFRAGHYEDFRNEVYSNVAMTKRALEEYFRDPAHAEKLYAPIAAASNH